MPQQGQVQGTPPLVGDVVTAGQQLFEVQTAPTDHRPLERIRGEIESVRKTAAALNAQIADLDTLKATLSKHFSDYKSARIAQAEKQATEQLARVSAANSRVKTAEFEHRMYQRLSNKGVSSDRERARAEYALEEARHELDVAQQSASRHQLQLDAARRGFFLGEGDGGQDRVASRQRCDEIEIQQAWLRSRLGELDGRLCELNARLESEEQYLAASSVPVVAPKSGVVWTSTLATGTAATPGSTVMELIDPGQLCIEAIFRDGDAERVRPGESVKARLLGSSQVLSGQIIRVFDPGMIEQEIVNLDARAPVHPNTFLAIVRLNDQPTGGNADNRYYIGSSAVVWMIR
jgi:multidrug resistance efflux pump